MGYTGINPLPFLSPLCPMFAHAQLGFPDLNLKLATPPLPSPAAHHFEYLDNQTPIYLCCDCHSHITSYQAILSRTFQGRVIVPMVHNQKRCPFINVIYYTAWIGLSGIGGGQCVTKRPSQPHPFNRAVHCC